MSVEQAFVSMHGAYPFGIMEEVTCTHVRSVADYQLGQRLQAHEASKRPMIFLDFEFFLIATYFHRPCKSFFKTFSYGFHTYTDVT